MAGNLGTLTLDLVAKLGGFTGPLGLAERQAKQFGKSVDSISNSMKVVAAGAAVFLAEKVISLGRAYVDMSRETAEAVDQIVNMAEAIGITTQAMDRLINVGKLQNIESGEITSAMQRLSKAFEEAKDPTSDQAKIFKILSEATGQNILKMTDMSKILLAVSDGFSKFEAGTARTTAATELFGKAGQRLLTLFSKSQDEMGDLTAEAEKFGGVLSDLEADKLKKIDAAFDHLGLAMQSFKRATADTSSTFIDNIALSIKGMGDFIAFEDRFVAHLKDGSLAIRQPFDSDVAFFERIEDLQKRQESFLPRKSTFEVTNNLKPDAKLPFPTVDPVEEKKNEELKKAGIALNKEMRTSIEQYADEMERLNLLIEKSDILLTTYSRASIKANDKLAESIGKDAASKKVNPLGLPDQFFFSQEDPLKKHNELMKEGAQLTEKLRVPTEKYAAELERLNELYGDGAISSEAFARGVDAASKELVDSDLAAKSAAEGLKKFFEEGVEVTKAQRKVTEEYADEVERLKDLLSGTAIEQETFNRAVKAAGEKGFEPPPGFDDQGLLDPAGKLNEQEKELNDWYAKQLQLLNDYRATKMGNEEDWNAKEQELNQQHADQLNAIEMARTKLALSSASDLFGSLAELAKNYEGESSSSYKALFALSKSFAIAKATIDLYAAISDAALSAPFPANLPAMATVASVMAGLVSSISSVGLAHEGMDYIPKSGSWMLEKGERVTTEKTSKRLDRTLDRIQQEQRTGAGSSLNVTVNEAPGTTAQVSKRNDGSLQVNISLIEERLLERMNRGTGLAGPFDRRYGRKY